jgi:Avidin family
METTKVHQLTGTWVNQLDSRLYLETDPIGSLHGSYVSAVGDLPGRPYPLLGFCDLGGPEGAATLGFVVHWTEDHSVTSWAGHYDPVTDEITTSWLLAYPAGIDPCRSWKSTLVGHDIFHRRETS